MSGKYAVQAKRIVVDARRALLVAFAAFAAGCADSPTDARLADGPSYSAITPNAAVFTSTNAAAGNAIVAFARSTSGELTQAGTYATGGLGLGSGIGSQGAVTLSEDKRWLLVVNAGSDDVSVFAVNGPDLTLTSRVPSGGDRPVSIAIHRAVVYVLNAGSDNLAGYSFREGQLHSIGAPVPLGRTGTAAAQVAFNPRGDLLVVTERATNRVTVFPVDHDGRLGSGTAAPSAGATPFGFDFHRNGTLVISEANGGAALGGLVSSYAIDDAQASAVTGALAIGESAPCWVVVSHDHKYAFVANAGTRTISALAIANDGSLSLITGAAARTGSAGPLDMAVTREGRFLYTVTPGSGSVHGFEIGANGALSSVATIGGLPTSAYGLAAI
jgi:6-phosphogluconolactonase (cycloisomerase 2 family)